MFAVFGTLSSDKPFVSVEKRVSYLRTNDLQWTTEQIKLGVQKLKLFASRDTSCAIASDRGEPKTGGPIRLSSIIGRPRKFALGR